MQLFELFLICFAGLQEKKLGRHLMHIFPHRGIKLSNDHLIFFQIVFVSIISSGL